MFHQIIKSKGNLFPNIREERERMSLSKHLPSVGTEIFLVILKIIPPVYRAGQKTSVSFKQN